MLERCPSLASARLVILQHALRDTAHFLRLMRDRGTHVGAFVAKPNSLDESAIAEIASLGIAVLRESQGCPPYSEYENTDVLYNLVRSEVENAKSTSRRLIFIDVGGYFLKPLLRLSAEIRENIAGIVEVTTFGHNRYVANADKLSVPVISLARSPLKDAEAVHVGETVVQATEDMLRDVGYILRGKRCGVIGHGMIGSRISSALKMRGVPVWIGDRNHSVELHARLNGVDTTDIDSLLREADIVFSATAAQSVSIEMLMNARDGVMLVSGGSRAQEFDVAGIRASAVKTERVSPHLEKFTFPWGRACVLANGGKAVNFLKGGSPEEVMDVVFAEQACCLNELLVSELSSGRVHELTGSKRNEIAAVWNDIQRSGGMARFRAGLDPL